ncbi:MAG: GAF domain-containing sensor histidine kinase [Candidatus Saccharimonadales bacterium]
MEETLDKSIRPKLVRKKKLQTMLDHVSQEMYLRNKELAETNKTLSLLRTIDALVLESHASLQMVCEHITEAITQATDHAFVGLLTRSSHTRDELTLNGWSGSAWLGKEDIPLGFSQPLHLKLTHAWFTQPQSTRLVSLEELSDDALADFLGCPTEDIKRVKQQLPLKSLYVVKLLARRHLAGLLVVGFLNSTTQLTQADTDLLDRLSESIGVALDNKLLFEENQYVLRQLRDTNAKLRALDETKDDFISMASHQLRTPLTSIKGYISMVLEEDAGKITPTQRDMLGQAFFSSQRMVYLIADLLNVSRLKTGKFVIEAKAVDLAQVVAEEIDQLTETAKVRGLTLTYDKPKTFPQLMLDETKTRQVIMNFVDNAIYYTPAGGHITVQLVNNPTTIELKVIDDGIGVPKSEQHHLFTKFYRAGNARKARPDGTGLGLFMAKKVVIAQDGSLIFESQEGKGSTFGFILSKRKLGVPAPKADTKPATHA